MKVANKNCRPLVEERTPFEGSNLHGDWVHTYEPTTKKYVVYSYGHYPIIIYDTEVNQWFGNSEKYSQSTGRQLSHAKPHNVDIKWLTTEDMRTVSHSGYVRLVQKRLDPTLPRN